MTIAQFSLFTIRTPKLQLLSTHRLTFPQFSPLFSPTGPPKLQLLSTHRLPFPQFSLFTNKEQFQSSVPKLQLLSTHMMVFAQLFLFSFCLFCRCSFYFCCCFSSTARSLNLGQSTRDRLSVLCCSSGSKTHCAVRIGGPQFRLSESILYIYTAAATPTITLGA